MERSSRALTVHETGLIERARAGDGEAFNLLMEAHLPRIWATVWRILRHREDTEDVVQEVFLAAYRAIPAFRGEARLSTWLRKIAMNRALNHLDRAAEKVRRASRTLGVPGHEEEGEALLALRQEPESTAPTPLQALEMEELRRRLAECLGRLPGVWRVVMALRDNDGHSYEEIGELLGIALGTVRSRLARARLALRRCVGEAS